jgi:hypothetical protein
MTFNPPTTDGPLDSVPPESCLSTLVFVSHIAILKALG